MASGDRVAVEHHHQVPCRGPAGRAGRRSPGRPRGRPGHARTSAASRRSCRECAEPLATAVAYAGRNDRRASARSRNGYGPEQATDPDCSCVARFLPLKCRAPTSRPPLRPLRGAPHDRRRARPGRRPWALGPDRTATRRRYLMCPPTHFAVEYAINPWMVPGTASTGRSPWPSGRAAPHLPRSRPPRRPARAGARPARHGLRGQRRHRRRRHRARRPLPPPAAGRRGRRARRPGSARAGLPRRRAASSSTRGRATCSSSGRDRRGGPGRHRLPHRPAGPRRGRPRCSGRPVVSLELVDPRYYHLDTAIAVLDATTIAWLPEAFTPAVAGGAARAVPGRRRRRPGRRRRPRAQRRLRRAARRAARRGRRLAAALAERGFVPVPVDLSELLKGGGGPKCCTLEVRP